jgi:hypothetical protein
MQQQFAYKQQARDQLLRANNMLEPAVSGEFFEAPVSRRGHQQ